MNLRGRPATSVASRKRKASGSSAASFGMDGIELRFAAGDPGAQGKVEPMTSVGGKAEPTAAAPPRGHGLTSTPVETAFGRSRSSNQQVLVTPARRWLSRVCEFLETVSLQEAVERRQLCWKSRKPKGATGRKSGQTDWTQRTQLRKKALRSALSLATT